MLIFNENNEIVALNTIYTPLVTKYCWITELEDKDFCLMEIKLLEEMVGPCVTISISGFVFDVPASWYMLVYSEETSDVDIVKMHDLMRGDFTALVCGPTTSKILPATVSVIDYHESGSVITPRLSKNQMLCHAIGPNQWVSISPYDQYNKTLKNCIAGDFV